MGLYHNFLLYFERERLWEALQGLARVSEPINPPPTTIHFPDYEIKLPFTTDFGEGNDYLYDTPKLKPAISLFFDEDEIILDYLLHNNNDWLRRAPPRERGIEQVLIGNIYLTVYTDLLKHAAFNKTTQMVLFCFGTTGTRMSLLFSESQSIRRTFSNLLEEHGGLIGIFDRENDCGELFWFKGRPMRASLPSNYLLPEEIAEVLKRNCPGVKLDGR
jgi:hypothetical protein